MIINWVNGICKEYVDGSVFSRRIKVSKTDGAVINAEILPEGFSEEDIRLVTEVCHKVEIVLGGFQDIEWTWADGRIVILQSRPVTTFKLKEFQLNWENDDDENYTWYRGRGPLTPLEEDYHRTAIQANNAGAYKSGLGQYYGQETIQNGYSYYRRKDMPGQDEKKKVYEHELDALRKEGKNVFSDIYLPRILDIHKSLEAYAKMDLSSHKLAEYFINAIEGAIAIYSFHWLVVRGCLYGDTLEKFKQRFNLSTPETVDLLYKETWFTKERDAIMRMVGIVKKNTELLKVFLEHEADEVVYAHLLIHLNITELIGLIQNYLNNYGDYRDESDHRKLVCEKPETIIRKIRSLLDSDVDLYFENKQRLLDRKRALYERLTKEMSETTLTKFRREYSLLEKSYTVRDNHSHYIDLTWYSYFHHACRKVGMWLAENQFLNDPEDLWFLRTHEIIAALKGDINYPDKVIEQRKAEWKQRNKLLAPRFIGKEPKKEDKKPVDEKTNRIEVKGYSGLAEKVVGEVRREDKLNTIKEGKYIIVLGNIRAVHPNRLYRIARGLIFDVGSPFDHIGILARECGIPALFNTRHGTRIFDNGDIVELDGVEERAVLVKKAD